MKRIILFVTAGIMVAAAHLCYCEESREVPKPAGQQTKHLSGTVAQVEFVEGFIVVFSDSGYITVQVGPDTLITRGSQKISLDDIDTGDSVMVQYNNPEPGIYVAVSIRDSSGSG